jgi:hypothetical protein
MDEKQRTSEAQSKLELSTLVDMAVAQSVDSCGQPVQHRPQLHPKLGVHLSINGPKGFTGVRSATRTG